MGPQRIINYHYVPDKARETVSISKQYFYHLLQLEYQRLNVRAFVNGELDAAEQLAAVKDQLDELRKDLGL